ncbi:hypothetical protein PAXRUDRAFT_825374 [Paxillus rubicundulus Ve08.2h10]|uniref:Unplaced genomic scaffold scaffold_135, whole genome shotgun sequence n=1 Tax=Paxillus rubicundulus Ve08.2h10 TaxID=930991 RepID=A0A0D0EB01_9AGAM|nr:hypothetical protein PAXRUDRAFT_825374 [Paxillus rubicundulus Ve08.2h10]
MVSVHCRSSTATKCFEVGSMVIVVGTDFTPINVAGAVHGSELPAQFAQMKAEQWANPLEMSGQKGAQQDIAEEDILAEMDWWIWNIAY